MTFCKSVQITLAINGSCNLESGPVKTSGYLEGLMKKIVGLMLICAQVFAWEKVLECNEGTLVVDRSSSDFKRSYQVVVRGHALEHFIKDGAPIKASSELVLDLKRNSMVPKYFYFTQIPVDQKRPVWLNVERVGESMRLRFVSLGHLLSEYVFDRCQFHTEP